MTQSVGAFEAKTKFSELIDKAEHGENVIITRRGKPVAMIGPLPAAMQPDNAIDLDKLRAIAGRFADQFDRPFQSTDVDALLYDDDGLPK